MRISLSIPSGLKLKEDFSLWQNQETKKEYLRFINQGDNLALLENFCRYVNNDHAYPPPWVLRGMAEILSKSLAKPVEKLSKAFGLSGKRGPDGDKKKKTEIVMFSHYLRYFFGLCTKDNSGVNANLIWPYLAWIFRDNSESTLEKIYKKNLHTYPYKRFEQLAKCGAIIFDDYVFDNFPQKEASHLRTLYHQKHGGVPDYFLF